MSSSPLQAIVDAVQALGTPAAIAAAFCALNDEEQADDESDDSQGDSRETQKAIEQMLEMSHTMFKHLVALNTYTEPFLSMKAADQREVIEQLLGITLLSEKAEALKILVKESKDLIQQESFKIEGILSHNIFS